MPSYFFEIPDVGTTVQKAVTDNVTKNVLANMGINHADIIYEGNEFTEQSQTGSTIGEVRAQSFGNAERIVLSVDETRDQLTRLERGTGYDIETPFFLDLEHGVKLSPSMVKYDVNVTVKRRAPSKAVVQRWCNEIQRKLDMGGGILETQAEFYFNIPAPALNLLKECHDTKFFGRAPEYDLLTYFKRYFTNNVTLTSNLSGAVRDYAVRYTELRILGVFDTDGPQVVKGDGFTAWECEFTFKFNYHRPEAVEACFPIILNNTLVSKMWWLDNLAPGLVDYSDGKAGSFVEAAMHIAEPTHLRLPLYIPQCDTPDLPYPFSSIGHIDLAIIHLEMDPSIDPPNLLFNLEGLGDEISLSELFLWYLKDSHSTDPCGLDSIFKIWLYEDSNLVTDCKVTVDQDFNVWYSGSIYISSTYRIRIVILMDWSELTEMGFDWLRQYPDFVQVLLDEFRPDVSDKVYIDPDRTNIKPRVLDNVVDELSNYDVNIKSGTIRTMITVHNNTLIAYRRNL